MKIKGKCHGCRKNKWFIRTRKVFLPIGVEAKSKDLLCNHCYKLIKKGI